MERLFTETDQWNSNKLSLSYTLKIEKKVFQHEQQTTDQTTPFHYDGIFQWYKFALDTCTQYRPIFVKQNKVKILLKILQLLSK